jgi:CRP-like cAMP-binding protein
MVITARGRFPVQDKQQKRRSVLVPSQSTPGKLSLELLQALQALKSALVFAKSAALYRQGYPVTGIYLVEAGEVRILLSTTHTQRSLSKSWVAEPYWGLAKA